MATFNPEIVKDIRIFEENRLSAHSDHEYFTDEAEAKRETTGFRQSLNGVWKFHYAKNPTLAPENFYETDYDASGWDAIKVPAHIQTQGFGSPAYVNTQYPWDGIDALDVGTDLPNVASYIAPVGSYLRHFTLPETMREEGAPVCISFQGVESALAVWVNGQYIGYSEDAFTPSEFDITSAVNRDGENLLAVRVFRYTASSWCDDQDFFRFSGIFRDVYLYTYPKLHIRDLQVETLLNDDYQDAELRLTFDTIGWAGRDVGKAAVTLSDADGNEIANDTFELLCGQKLSYSLAITNPEKWSAESPYLYDLSISVYDEGLDANGNALSEKTEFIPERVGFRRFEMKDNLMCLNGKRIVFFGVNRHEFSAESGRAIADEDILKDIITMKQNNINAIRTSHYPNRTLLYRLCDEYGLYMIDETNHESHGYWDSIQREFHTIDQAVPGDREDFLPMMLDRAKSMYERDKNHPAILIWSLGNESFGGSMLLKMSNEIRSWDPSRLVHYEGVFWDPRYPETTDMISTMYRPVDEIREVLQKDRTKPYISCEYAHAMGNSNGGIYKYTKLTEEEPLYQGGFIWDYIDQSMTLHDRYGNEFQGYGGDFGERPHDGSFSGNGIVYGKDREPSPKMQEVKFAYQPLVISFDDDNNMTVRNKHLFTPSGAYFCLITLEQEGVLIDSCTGEIDVPPLSEKTLPIPLDLPEEPETEYVLTVSFCLREDTDYAEAGHEVAYGQKIIGEMPAAKHIERKMTVIRGWCNTGVRGETENGEPFSMLFSNLHAGLISYKIGNRELIKLPPKPNFWRALTENDIANLLPFRAGQWKIASLYLTPKYENGRKATDYVVEEADDGQTVSITYTYHLPTNPSADVFLTYTVHSDGVVDVTQKMTGADKLGQLPEFSTLFTMDADFAKLTWYGLGPEETYADKNHAKLDVYEGLVSDNMAKYLRPQECGNKEGVRYAEVTDKNGYGLRFTMLDDTPFSFSALPYSPHELDSANHPNELPPVLSTFIRVEKAQMGVGGDDTWGALVHPEYLLEDMLGATDEISFSYSFRGICN